MRRALPPGAPASGAAGRLCIWAWEMGQADRLTIDGGVPGLTSLSALYDMLRTQSDLRSLQLAHARRSCAEQALQRSLGQSAAPTHGWEDLAAFATISP